MTRRPRCLLMAGPNGAGKSTHANRLVHGTSGIATYINSDLIATGLAGSSLHAVAFDAGRLALRAIDACMQQQRDFAFETTLSGRRWPQLLDRLRDAGYDVLLHYLWIRDVDECVARVARRVAIGGHHVPESDIRRRYDSSIRNCLTVFLPRVQHWQVHDASQTGGLNAIASGTASAVTSIDDAESWRQFTAASRRDIVREVAMHQYLHTSPTERTVPEQNTPPASHASAASSDAWVPSAATVEAESRIAVRRALAIHRALGVEAVGWEDGKIVIIPPEELPRDVNDLAWTERMIARQRRSTPAVEADNV